MRLHRRIRPRNPDVKRGLFHLGTGLAVYLSADLRRAIILKFPSDAVGVALLLLAAKSSRSTMWLVGGEFSQLPRRLVAAVSGVDIGSVDNQKVDHVDFSVRGGEMAWLPCRACVSCAFPPGPNQCLIPASAAMLPRFSGLR